MKNNSVRDQLKEPDPWNARIKPQIEHIAISTMKAWPKEGTSSPWFFGDSQFIKIQNSNEVGHRNYSFELVGLDIMLDKDLNAYLLEVNTNTGLHMLTDVVRPHHRRYQTLTQSD